MVNNNKGFREDGIMTRTIKPHLLAMIAGISWNGFASAQLSPNMPNAAIIRNLPGLPWYGVAGGATMVGADGSVLTARWGYSLPLGGPRYVSPYVNNSTTYQASRALRKAQRDSWSNLSPEARPNPSASATLASEYRALSAPASDESILSGAALNQSLSALLGMEKSGERQAKGEISSETIQSIRFAGPTGDLLNWIRAGEIEFPPLLQTADYEIPLKWLKSDFPAAVQPFVEGKQADAARLNAIAVAGRRIREIYTANKAKYSMAEQKEIEAFTNRFSVAMAALGNSANRGLIDADWAKYGLSMATLLDHMAKYKLTFGPAGTGQEQTYREFHSLLSTAAKQVAELFK
jgi:hypothetical protein